MRDVSNGWLIRYLHANTASAFFFLVAHNFYLFFFTFIINYPVATIIPYSIFDLLTSQLTIKGPLMELNEVHGKRLTYSPMAKTQGVGVALTSSKQENISKFNIALNSLSDENFHEWFRGFVEPHHILFKVKEEGIGKLLYNSTIMSCITYLDERNYRFQLPSKRISFLQWNRRALSSTNIAITYEYTVKYRYYSTSKLITSSVSENKSLVIWGKNLTSTTGEKFTRKELAMIKLPPYQYSVIIGLLLSDGWLIYSNVRSLNVRLGFKQSADHASYVWFVFNILSHYCSSNIKVITSIRSGKPVFGLEFFTRTMPCLTELHSLFYIKGVKVIPCNIYELLTPVALAHLIMGDGGLVSNGISFCTDSYSIQDVVRLMNVLIIRYNLKCTLHKASNGKGYRIYISRNSMSKVVEIVKPHFIPSMLYKLGGDELNLPVRRNEGVKVLNEKCDLLYSFQSIKECALFFNVNIVTIYRRLKKDSVVEYNGKIIRFKRGIQTVSASYISGARKYSTLSNTTLIRYEDTINRANFLEWFRGFVDSKGCFSLQPIDNRFKFIFTLCLHKDEAPLLEYIGQKLGIGQVFIKKDTVNYTVIRKVDLLKIFSILDKKPLNTSKHLNYIMFRQGYDLYFNRESNKVSKEIFEQLFNLKNQMNKKRIEFDRLGDPINITAYWLLGFTEGDGYFSVNKKYFSLKFGIGQNYKELPVMEAIQKFLLSLLPPVGEGKYSIKRSNTNPVKLATYDSAKGRNDEPMCYITVNQTDFISNVILPFFDSVTWLSKKKYDYQDWKLVLNILNEGKHFTDEGKELILQIANRMNNNRLSTNIAQTKPLSVNIKEIALKLLSSPSNYEIQTDGKILIKSTGTYLKGRGNIGVKVLDDKGEIIYSFNSIKNCALFFNVHSRTIIRRLDSGKFIEFKGKILVFKREVPLL